MVPFSEAVLAPAHGVAVTSATLRDNQTGSGETEEEEWHSARLISGAAHLPHPALVSAHKSPFDYEKQARIFLVNDITRERHQAVAAAMVELMIAANGGALGLFTSIQRLKNTYPELETRLRASGIPLHAQHIDRMSLQTLLQLFREDSRSCLIGTDAVRDGVDVPGEALQMIIYDRVPWPRPDMLFKARAKWQGRDAWTDRMTRMRLRQAFGRLIRRSDDKGVFVMLDSRLPTRLTSAFPPEVDIIRTGLADAITQSRDFLKTD
jgi:ATP-dependent DNA helicase DinG